MAIEVNMTKINKSTMSCHGRVTLTLAKTADVNLGLT